MRPFIALAAAAILALAMVPVVQHRARADDATPQPASPNPSASPAASVHKAPSPPPLTGIDLAKLHVDTEEVTAPGVGGRVAHLSLSPTLQRAARKILNGIEAPE